MSPGEAGQPGSRREPRPEDPYDDGSSVRAIRREEPPAARRHDGRSADSHEPFDGSAYGDDDWHEHGSAASAASADSRHSDDPRRGRGANNPFATGVLPLRPTIGIALAAVILAFILGHVTAGGGSSDSAASTVTTSASTTTTTVVPPVATVTVPRGGTLSAIATQNGVDLQALAAYNNIAPPYVVFVGQVINIPPQSP